MTELKTIGVEIKAAEGEDGASGVFEAFAAVIGNVDRHGDRIMPGAFDETLKAWASSGSPIPVVWSHQWSNPEAHVGVVLEAAEKTVNGKTGLWIKGQNDLDQPFAAQVHRLLMERRVTNFSFAYDVQKSSWVEEPAAEGSDQTVSVRELEQLNVFEVGPTLIGANGETDLLEAASLQLGGALAGKAGRVLSGKNAEALTSARDLIDGVLASSEGESDDGKSSPSPAPRDSGSSIDLARRVNLLAKSRHEKE